MYRFIYFKDSMKIHATYCSAEKSSTTGEIPAIERYTSRRIQWVNKRAQRHGEAFFILSGKYSALGVNERFRFLKYSAGQYFKPHFDGTYKRPDGRSRSMVTIQIYLNEGMEGGTTTILSPSITGETYKEDDVIARVVPKVGRILLFDHNTMHEGSLLTKGVKYTVRTEIMYDIPHDK